MLVKITKNMAVNPEDVKFIQGIPINKTKIVLNGHTVIVEEEIETVLKRLNKKENPVADAILELAKVIKWKTIKIR